MAAQPLLVSETMGKALAAEVTPCAAGCGAVSGHPISEGCKTGRFRRQGARAAPISAGARAGFVGMLRVVCLYLTQLPSWRAEKQIGRRHPAPLAAAQETSVVCCLYSGGAHRRPPMHRTGTQGCAPVLYAHCCRRSPRQIRGRGASDAAAKCSSIGHVIKVSYLCHEHCGLLGNSAMSHPPVLPAPPASGRCQLLIASCTPAILPDRKCTGRLSRLCIYNPR